MLSVPWGQEAQQMGFLDRLFGADEQEQAPVRRAAPAATTDDERALERYRYLLRTAPPETIEQAHAEAFAQLTDEQRAMIYEELSKGSGTGERPLSSEPATLARAATRAEFRQPGAMERVMGARGGAGGMGFGGMVASSLLGTVAGYVIGSALVSAFLPWDGGAGGDANADGGDSGSSDGSGDGSGDAGSTDAGATDASAADAGTGYDGGGDFGGGDFGGGDFGGDFGF